LPIYLELAERYPQNVRYIIIRQVYERSRDAELIGNAKPLLEEHNIGLYYSTMFPEDLPGNLVL
jgi:phosphatidate phosphatase APP1